MLSRRQFLASSAAMLAAPSFAADAPRKKVAFLGTTVFTHSHSQHFLDRLTVGYAWKGRWQPPRVDLASVYIEQFGDKDVGRPRIERHKLPQFNSIADALTLGESKLAVDGVVVIAEHGDYPSNEIGQKLYPRYKWFKEVVKVFEASGRSVPVFNDKHLSTDWKECVEMVDDAKRLKFPFLAGSSLPVTRRFPAVDMPYGADLRESVCVAYGGIDLYDIHALETCQCMSERRKGGEVGISRVLALKGEPLWAELDKEDRRSTRELMVAALTRSHNLPVVEGYPSAPVTYEWAKMALPETIGYFVEHRDGFKTSIFLANIRDFNYAGRIGDGGEILTCQMYLPMPGHGSTTADFFNPLTRHIEDLVLTGKAAYPAERTLLTSGMTLAGVQSLASGKVVETPEMAVTYAGPRESTFWAD
jgi:hypothetical protein